MKDFILDELGIERWHKRAIDIPSETILVVMKKQVLAQEKIAIFFKQILQSIHLQHTEIILSDSMRQDTFIPPSVRFVWFVGEPSTRISKPMVVSPSLAVLMQDGVAKKKLYRCLCDAIAV